MAKHDFYQSSYGGMDSWRIEWGYHNGPECRRCGEAFCEHCEPERLEEECPDGQLEFLDGNGMVIAQTFEE